MKNNFKTNWMNWVVGLGGFMIMIFGVCNWGTVRLYKNIINGEEKKTLRLVKWCGGSLPFVQQIDKLLGGRYIVLLQNNYELRSTGGFMGSYAIVDFKQGLSVIVKDIYDADGKLPGHVEPPYPIQEAFLQGWWKLRDANWAVDYPKAAADIAWFLEQGGEKPVDGIVAVNMKLIEKWLDVVGGVEVVTYGQKVTSKNLYILAQSEAEVNFFPGSTQKRDFLGAVGTALLERIKSGSVIELIKFIKLFWGELENRQTLVWFKDKELQTETEKWEWEGGLAKLPVGYEYLYIVESNLGANKANCCINRDFYLDLERNENIVKHNLRIIWRNENEFSEKKPPVFWGGDYYDYVRLVVNDSKTLGTNDPKISVDGKELRKAVEEDFKMPNSLRTGISWDLYNIEPYGDFRIIGLWVRTKAKSSSEVKVSWISEYADPPGYNGVVIDRQPGVDPFKLVIDFNGKRVFENEVAKRLMIGVN